MREPDFFTQLQTKDASSLARTCEMEVTSMEELLGLYYSCRGRISQSLNCCCLKATERFEMVY
jgi:hypothetical protein